MGAESKFAGWAVHFPGNLRWSNAMQIVKGMAPYGQSRWRRSIDRRRLKAREGEGEPDRAWREEWSAMADRVAQSPTRPRRRAAQITAGNHYMRAGNYYYSAERFIRPATRSWRCIARRCAATRRRWRGSIRRSSASRCRTRARACRPISCKGRGRRQAPTVVLFDGMDNAKEMSVIFAGLDFAKRGINTLAIDGPGQSEPLRLRNIHSRHDYEVAGTPAYDYVAARPEVDPKRVAVMGYSFGGYHAPRVAPSDKRYAACVAFGAMHWSITTGHRQQGEARSRSAQKLDLDLPVPLGDRRARQRDRARMGEEVHARRHRADRSNARC